MNRQRRRNQILNLMGMAYRLYWDGMKQTGWRRLESAAEDLDLIEPSEAERAKERE